MIFTHCIISCPSMPPPAQKNTSKNKTITDDERDLPILQHRAHRYTSSQHNHLFSETVLRLPRAQAQSPHKVRKTAQGKIHKSTKSRQNTHGNIAQRGSLTLPPPALASKTLTSSNFYRYWSCIARFPNTSCALPVFSTLFLWRGVSSRGKNPRPKQLR